MKPANAALLALSVVALTLLAVPLRAADPPGPEAGSAAEREKHAGWSFEPDPKLPNVLILGDSISIGYTLQVRDLLAGRANVYRPLGRDGKSPANCNGTTDGVRHLDAWLGNTKWSVIHFNFGLHDLKHVRSPGDDTISENPADPHQATPEQYEKNLRQIVAKLKGTGAKLVFATTTPVPPGAKGREPDQPAVYNEVALKVMRENGIEVDDLFALVSPHLEAYQLPRDVHYKPAGYAVLAKQVAGSIEKALAP